MFTVGIFSTHLPYIAFVFFYVFFLMVGIPRATPGELVPEEKIIRSEIPVSKNLSTPVADYQTKPVYGYESAAIDFGCFTKERLKLFLVHFKPPGQGNHCLKRFSRPPPLS